MRHRISITVLTTLFIPAFVYAQSSGGDFEIVNSTVDNGGGTSTGGDFSLTGTIGQPEANPQSSSGGEFKLAGGFWANAVDAAESVILFGDSFEDLTPAEGEQ